MVPETVPAWNCTCFDEPNTASVVFAGMVKLIVRPPLANWMFGSSPKEFDANDNVSLPVRSIGYGCASESPTEGCCSAVAVAGTLPNVTLLIAGGGFPLPR